MNRIEYKDKARDIIRNGVNQLENAVKVTLGQKEEM